MKPDALLHGDLQLCRRARLLLASLPSLAGAPILIERSQGLRSRYGPSHAGSFLRQRRVAFDCSAAEFPRIFVHELFHFVWVRTGNPCRLAYEELVRGELEAGVSGELGWSAECRKQALSRADRTRRTRRWREYCCESFCDTAAWFYAARPHHPECTLPSHFRQLRRKWFRQSIALRRLSI